MYFRKKTSKGHTYLQLVSSTREDGRVKQRIIATLGRLDELEASGQLASLLASGANCSEEVSILAEHKRGEINVISKRKIGPGLIFKRLWQESGISDAINSLLGDRKFEFDVNAAIFLTVMHRLLDPGSDRAAQQWKDEYDFGEAAASLDLQHFYRAMAWLGEKLSASEQAGHTPFAPRCTKDRIEEEIFAARRTLFTDVAVVLFDTTSIYFEGEGGQTIGARGHSKDSRPDLKQMVVGLVIDGDGRPLCCELWPGNTTDVTTLVPIITRLEQHFRISQVCLVADRGMMSKDTIATIEENGNWWYILGMRMRKTNEIKQNVIKRGGSYHEVEYHRMNGLPSSPLKVKEVGTDNGRYVVCLNESQARKDAADRSAIITSLEEQLKGGAKSLVGNKGFRRYLSGTKDAFAIDYKKAKEEARFDGKWVLKTNTPWSTDEVALTYKRLWMVETLFRTMKSVLSTRPIYHKRDETIRGHVFCSFLALLLRRELEERMWGEGYIDVPWAEVLRDLDFLDETEIESQQNKRYIIRGPAKGWCSAVFQSVGVAMPKNLRRVAKE